MRHIVSILLCALVVFAGCAKPQDPVKEALLSAKRLAQQGRYFQASLEVDRAIRYDPRRYQTYQTAMDILSGSESESSRISELMITRAQSGGLDRKLSPDEVVSIYDQLAATYWYDGDQLRACSLLKRGLAAYPNEPILLNDLGWYYAERGVNLPEAIKLTTRAVKMRPKTGYIVDSLGWAQYKSGDYAAAVVTLKKAVSLDTSDPEIRYHLAAAYAEMGRKREARAELRTVVKQDSSMSEASSLLSSLGK